MPIILETSVRWSGEVSYTEDTCSFTTSVELCGCCLYSTTRLVHLSLRVGEAFSTSFSHLEAALLIFKLLDSTGDDLHQEDMCDEAVASVKLSLKKKGKRDSPVSGEDGEAKKAPQWLYLTSRNYISRVLPLSHVFLIWGMSHEEQHHVVANYDYQSAVGNKAADVCSTKYKTKVRPKPAPFAQDIPTPGHIKPVCCF